MHENHLEILLKSRFQFSKSGVGPELLPFQGGNEQSGIAALLSKAHVLGGKIITICVNPEWTEVEDRGSMKMDFLDFLFFCFHLYAQIGLTFLKSN